MNKTHFPYAPRRIAQPCNTAIDYRTISLSNLRIQAIQDALNALTAGVITQEQLGTFVAELAGESIKYDAGYDEYTLRSELYRPPNYFQQ